MRESVPGGLNDLEKHGLSRDGSRGDEDDGVDGGDGRQDEQGAPFRDAQR